MSKDFNGIIIKFGAKQHLKQLQQKGLLYCRNIHESAQSDGNCLRLDEQENLVENRFLEKGEVMLKPVGAPDSEFITLNADNTNLSTWFQDPLGNLFCCTAINVLEFGPEKSYITDVRLAGFGSHYLVITDVDEFLSRLHVALHKRNLKYEHKLVEYKSFKNFTGRKTIFQKDLQYAYQSEFRVLIKNEKPDLLILEIGDLRDISSLQKFKSANQVKFYLQKKEDIDNSKQ